MDNPNINEEGKFKSSKHPDLPVDRVRLNVVRKENWPALLMIADSYREIDPEFAEAIWERVHSAAAEQNCTMLQAVAYLGIQGKVRNG